MKTQRALPESVPQWYTASIARAEQMILQREAMVGIRQDQRIAFASEIVRGSKQGDELKALHQQFDALTREIRYNQEDIERLRTGIKHDYDIAGFIFPQLSFSEKVRNWWLHVTGKPEWRDYKHR